VMVLEGLGADPMALAVVFAILWAGRVANAQWHG
jgi:hypothetical protein